MLAVGIIIAGCLHSGEPEVAENPEVWIEIHDVSPGWKYWRVEEILEVIERHPTAYSRVVLFIIPNHANITPLYAYPEFVQELKALEDRGYILGCHGYAHPTPPELEFNVSLEEAEELLRKARSEFEKAGLDFPAYFAPPGWQASPEVSSYLDEIFDYVYYGDHLSTPQGVKPYTSNEYTWQDENLTLALEEAKKTYSQTKEVFRLTVHVGRADTENGLMFLDEFLGSIKVEDKVYVLITVDTGATSSTS
jgi:predicted deacetylase